MFDNIGGKIKTIAIVNFCLGIGGSLLAAFLFFIASLADEEYMIYVIVALIGCPISAFISTCFVYAFGELVENSTIIREKLQGGYSAQRFGFQPKAESLVYTPRPAPKPEPEKSEHAWRCPECGAMRTKEPCEYCHPYKCGSCGKLGPFGAECPDCGSSIRIFNV